MTRTIRWTAGLVAVAALGWALLVLMTGGRTFNLGGRQIRSNDAARPAQVAVGALAVCALAGGLLSLRTRRRQVIARWPAAERSLSPPMAALAAALLATGLTLAYATTSAGGADASGYVSQADLWLRGSLMPLQPLADGAPWPDAPVILAPVGYRAVDTKAPWRQAPTYSPGLPLMMAAAKLAAGQAGLYAVVPLSAGVLVLATFGLGSRWRDPRTGALAAWFVATSPTMLWVGVLPWSDVPAAAAWTVCAYCLCSPSAAATIAAGLAASVAVLIRPNLIFLVPVLGVWHLLRPSPDAHTPLAARIRSLALFGVTALPGVVFLLALFNHLFGSPFVSGYGAFSDMLDRSHVWTNLRQYTRWALTMEPMLVGLGLAGLAGGLWWTTPAGRRLRIVGVLVLVALGAEYTAYLVFAPDEWMYLRFFLPVWPWLAVGAAALLMSIWARMPRPVVHVAIVVIVAEIGLLGLTSTRNGGAFTLWQSERRYPAVSAALAEMVPPGSVVLGLEHTGSVRYYAGLSPMRFDLLNAAWLDRSVAWLQGQGVHVYAVLNAEEVDAFRTRFAGQRAVEALDRPILVYRTRAGQPAVFAYELGPASTVRDTIQSITELNPRRWRNAEPALVLTAPE